MSDLNARFKIDYSGSGTCPNGLFVRRTRFMFSDGWERIDYFRTRDEALALYEQVKNLPEYLP